MKICTIGAGYVGLASGACFADMGHSVICVDIDEDRISKLKKGVTPFYEQDLNEIVKSNYRTGRISFSTDIAKGVRPSDIVLITVGTPRGNSGAADLSSVKAVAKEAAKAIDQYKIIVNKSTAPIGSTKLIQSIIEEEMPDFCEFDVVSNPEFLRQGAAVADFMHPDRIIVGTNSEKAALTMKELYGPFDAPILVTTPEVAEMIKYASNAFLAMKISFTNAIANVCSSVGVDVEEVVQGMGYDRRIGHDFLQPGPGFGGSCLGKDCRALIKMAEDNGYDFYLLKKVMQVNEDQKKFIFEQIRKSVGDLRNKQIGILGLAFKPETDDMRDAPAISIIDLLQDAGASIKAYDPKANNNAEKILRDVQSVSDAYQVAEDSDALVLLTHWNEFKELDFQKIKSLVRQPIIIDARNYLDSENLKQLGFEYRGVGKR